MLNSAEIVYHSQPATSQDKWLVEKLGLEYDAVVPRYFVEVGAHNGVRHSNTLTLENHFGWTGLLVEPNPELFKVLKTNRPKCDHSNVVVGPYNSYLQNFAIGQGPGDAFSGLLKHMTREWYENHSLHGSKIVQVETRTLRSVLELHNCPDIIDYLSLDVEGAELPILQSFMEGRFLHYFRSFEFRFITVEFRYDHALLSQLESLLEPLYVLDSVRAFDACFVHRTLGV